MSREHIQQRAREHYDMVREFLLGVLDESKEKDLPSGAIMGEITGLQLNLAAANHAAIISCVLEIHDMLEQFIQQQTEQRDASLQSEHPQPGH